MTRITGRLVAEASGVVFLAGFLAGTLSRDALSTGNVAGMLLAVACCAVGALLLGLLYRSHRQAQKSRIRTGLANHLQRSRATIERLERRVSAAETHAGMLTMDGDGRIRTANQHFCGLCGYSEEELRQGGLELLGVILGGRTQLSDLRGVVQEGDVWRGELRLLTRNGGIRWLAATAFPRQPGDSEGFALMATDITQHVPMAEAAVSARTSRIELPEGSGGWQVNLAAGAVALDARSCELFGWHEDERHMSIDEYVSCVHPDERAMVRAALDDVRRDASRQFNVEFRVPSGTGDWRWLSVRASASAGSGADSSTLVGLHVDVTPARLFALDLEQARLAANVAVRNMRGLLARMSHEIRTPMNGVLGYLELLGATQLTAAQHEYVDVATSSADGLLKVVDEVLDYSRGEDGRLEAEMLRFNPARLVGDVLALMTPVATGQGVTLAAPAGEGFGDDVIGDAFKVRQVLLNLVGNAIKFTPGGRVTVAGKRVEHPSGMPRLHFEVADTGAGLAGVDIALLFEPYAQAEVSTARRFGGTGLGLAICRQLVDVLDGSIEAGTNDNGGATFRFEVPVLVPALSATEDIDRAPMVDADAAELSGRLHVLVVDDDATSRALLCTMLTRLGCRVDTATDGAEALALWSQVRHDLVLLDRYMPGMDGLAATRALRAAEAALPGPPHRSRVVAVTASSTDEDRQSCVAAGMDDVFAKPVRHQALVRLLLREQRLRERGHGAPPEAS